MTITRREFLSLVKGLAVLPVAGVAKGYGGYGSGTTEAELAAPPMAGRVSETEATLRAVAAERLETQWQWREFGWGHSPRAATFMGPLQLAEPHTAIDQHLTGLTPNRNHEYELFYRRPGGLWYTAGPGRFFTGRPPGSGFSFGVLADPHTYNAWRGGHRARLDLYGITQENLIGMPLDFCLQLGDNVHSESSFRGDARDYEECRARHYLARRLGKLAGLHCPVISVRGNHEGVQHWRELAGDSLPSWVRRAENLVLLQPAADYWSIEWGDALFIGLDPYIATAVKPHPRPYGGPDPGSGDAWDWTLGADQYSWLKDILETTTKANIFVVIHQLTGGCPDAAMLDDMLYGRGGAGAVPFFEWGGHGETGAYEFDQKRAAPFTLPIHALLWNQVVGGQRVFVLRGHDHHFGLEDVDGVTYLTCPKPTDRSYSMA
ncbi:MAG: metallophosphoesterase family protein, partial [Planctomycetota bacterium]